MKFLLNENILGEMRYYAFGETRLATGTMFTDRLYTSQRFMSAIGLYDYNARFYSATMGRFISADTMVPNSSNSQSFNRYSYANNNPLRYTDPSGHFICSSDINSDDYCPNHGSTIGTTTGSYSGTSGGGSGGGSSGGGDDDGNNSEASMSSSCPTCIPVLQPDAYYGSLSISAGVGPWYAAWSFDMVVTNDQIGFFSVSSLGPGFGGDEYFGHLNDYESTFMSPQLGAIFYGGGLWGNTLLDDVQNYQGPALIGGAGAGQGFGGGVEVFSSVDPQTGLVDGNIVGVGAGPSAGLNLPIPIEAHLIYADAEYQPGLSSAATTIGGWLGIVQP